MATPTITNREELTSKLEGFGGLTQNQISGAGDTVFGGDSLTQTANNAGVETPQTTPTIDSSVIGTPGAGVPSQPQATPSSSAALIQSIADVPSAVADSGKADVTSQRIEQLIGESTGQSAFRAREEERLGVGGIEQQIADINADIERQRASLKAGLVNEEGRVVPMGVITGRQAFLEKQSAAIIEGLSAAQSAAEGNLLVAESSIQRSVDAKFGPVLEELQAQKDLLLVQEATMTREEKKLAEAREAEITMLQAEITQAQALEQSAQTMITTAITNGFSATEGARLLKGVVNGSLTPDQAIAAVGGFQKSELERLQEQKLRGELSGGGGIDLLSILSQEGGEFAKGGDEGIINSSEFDKELDISSIESINQAKLALAGVENLNALLMQGEDGIALSGPITGRKRDFLTKLGGDADAAAINAALQGLIPTVARGIFKEVGVLTDTDIENYKKTMPNLTSSEDQNRLITLIMLDVLENSFTNTLKSNAQAGRNVSRFYPDLLDIRSRVHQQKLSLGVTSFSGQSNDDFIDSVPDTVTTQVDNLATDFNSFMNIK